MNNITTDIDTLIVSYLSGEISDNELKMLNSWKAESDANLIDFEQYVALWNKSKALDLFNQVKPEDDWAKVQARLSAQSSGKVIHSAFGVYRKVAAVLLPLLLVGSASFFMYWNVPGFGRWNVAKSTNTIKEVILPDNSTLLLNKNSKVIFLNKFKEDSREVKLKGEAFFNVTHNNNKPFVVKTDDINVTVLGTEFNVNQTNKNTYISVLSGKVQVEAENNKSVILTQGERGIYADGLLNEENTNVYNDFYWYSQKLEFKQATLSEICTSLKKAYPKIKDVKFQAKKSDIKITTTFHKQPLKEVIEELHIHFGKKITFDGKVLTISE